MTTILPYLCGVVTLLFGVAFYLAMQDLQEFDPGYPRTKDGINPES